MLTVFVSSPPLPYFSSMHALYSQNCANACGMSFLICAVFSTHQSTRSVCRRTRSWRWCTKECCAEHYIHILSVQTCLIVLIFLRLLHSQKLSSSSLLKQHMQFICCFNLFHCSSMLWQLMRHFLSFACCVRRIYTPADEELLGLTIEACCSCR